METDLLSSKNCDENVQFIAYLWLFFHISQNLKLLGEMQPYY